MGAVGLDWQVAGFGNFSSRGTSDMILQRSTTSTAIITGAAFMGVVVMRNTNTGGMVIYDISNNQVASAFFIGAVGLDWQLGGIAADRGRRTMDQSAAGAMGRALDLGHFSAEKIAT